MKNRLAALLLALVFAALPLAAQDQPKPPADKPLAAPAGDAAKGEGGGEEVGRRRAVVRVRRQRPSRRRRGDLDVGRRLPRRQGDRLRPARRPLHDADRRRRGEGAHVRDRVGHAAALLARRQVDRVHVRPLRRRQHLDRRPRRQEPAAGDEGDPSASPTPPPGRPTRSTSPRASTSPARARSAPARSGSTTARAARACR